jgi:hypothetical protein
MCFRKIGFQFYGAIKGGNGFLQALQLHQDEAAIMVGTGGLGVYCYGSVQADQRFLISAKHDQCAAKIGLRFRASWIDRDRAADQGYAFCNPSSFGANDASVMQCVEIARITLDDRSKTGLGVGGAALPEKRHGFRELLFDGQGWRLHLIS